MQLSKSNNTLWSDRIRAADDYYDKWEDLFKCEKLEEYYENFQHQVANYGALITKPYTVNLIFAAIQTKLANFILNNPEFEVNSKPGYSDWDQETAYDSSLVKQDTINTIVADPNNVFVETIKLAALDYFFRFSVIKVGLAIDWRNPNKLNPDIEIPSAEHIYFDWIPARRFRVSVADSYSLKRCSWCGHYKYYYRDSLEKIKSIKFPDQADLVNAQFTPDYKGPARIISNVGMDHEEDPELEYLIRNNEVIKVLMAYDNRKQEELMIHVDTGNVMWHEPADKIMLATNRANFRLKGWYPIPPVWYWISPQNEVNEARQQMQNYRRRYKRKFAFLKGKVTTTELDKLSSDIDGEAIEEKEREAIRPIANPEIGISIQASLEVGYSDFNLIAGQSEVKEGDRETATKTKTIAVKQGIRENVERVSFDNMVCETARLALITLSERGTLPMYVQYTVDPSEELMGEINAHGPAYRQIYMSQLDDGYDFTVKIHVKEATPAQIEEEMQKFVAFLSIINTYPQIMLSPILIREAAYKTGYRNIQAIKQMQQMALLYQMSLAAGMQQQNQSQPGGNAAGNASRNALENAAPNPTNEINNQLFSQV